MRDLTAAPPLPHLRSISCSFPERITAADLRALSAQHTLQEQLPFLGLNSLVQTALLPNAHRLPLLYIESQHMLRLPLLPSLTSVLVVCPRPQPDRQEQRQIRVLATPGTAHVLRDTVDFSRLRKFSFLEPLFGLHVLPLAAMVNIEEMHVCLFSPTVLLNNLSRNSHSSGNDVLLPRLKILHVNTIDLDDRGLRDIRLRSHPQQDPLSVAAKLPMLDEIGWYDTVYKVHRQLDPSSDKWYVSIKAAPEIDRLAGFEITKAHHHLPWYDLM